ncbi:MAG: M28 family peptidase [Candidatus Eiseniibacteriota bacterium]|jgi:hypothetical protein
MRLVALLVCLLPLLVPATQIAAAPAERALVVVEHPSPGTVAALIDADVMVVRDMQRYVLVAAAPGDRSRLDALGLDWRVLDPVIGQKTYFTVGFTEDVDPAAMLPPGARLLRFDGAEAVVEGDPASIEHAFHRQEIARVFMRPVRLPAPRALTSGGAAPRGARLTPDPEIQQMVDQVDGATIDATVQRLQDFVTRYASSDSCAAAAQWIHDQFVSFGIDSVAFHHWSSQYNDNVYAVLPGTRDPEQIVILGGHYDSTTGNPSVAPGADDDASGTACVVEVARVLAGYELDYTVVCVAFCAEEQGLLGSEAFAGMAASQGWNVIGAICVDMIGYLAPGDLLDLDIIRNTSSQWMRDLAGEVQQAYVPELPMVTGSLPFGASSDHASFWANGFDALLFFEDTGDYSPYIHSADDVVGTSYNSPVLAEGSVKIATGLVATMAKAPAVTIAHTPLEHTTNTQDPYRVAAEIIATGQLNPDSLLVRYRTGGAWNDLVMTPSGAPDEFEAYIPAQPGGTWVDYFLVAENTESYRVTHPTDAPETFHSFFVGTITTVVEDDFEAASGWTVGDIGDNATTGIWLRADPVGTYSGSALVQPEDDHTEAPGVACFVTGNTAPGGSQGSNDVDGGKTTVLSPLFDLSARPNAWVRYYRWYTNDTGSSPESDEWAVDVSSDGGATWNRIESTYASDRSWLLVERDLGQFIELTDQVRFRFIARDDEPGSIVEAAIDDFALVSFQEPTTAIAGSEPAATITRVSLGQNVPNPFNPETTIHFAIPSPERPVTLRIYDVAGRAVSTLLERVPLAGAQTLRWDGRADDGQPLASGIYFMRLEASDSRLVRKLVLAR